MAMKAIGDKVTFIEAKIMGTTDTEPWGQLHMIDYLWLT